MTMLQLTGRQSSHFTRVPRIFAHELGLELTLVPVFDLAALDADDYAHNPALKIPTLRRGSELVFGAENICRVLWEVAGESPRVIWPEHLRGAASRNGQELVWTAMAAQVQHILGTRLGKLPADNVFFVKGRLGLQGALLWLDGHLMEILRALPEHRSLSLFEVTLFCLLEHLRFRGTVLFDQHAALLHFVETYGQKQSCIDTPYRVDTRP